MQNHLLLFLLLLQLGILSWNEFFSKTILLNCICLSCMDIILENQFEVLKIHM